MSNKEELKEVIVKAQNGDMEAKDYIVRKYKWLVEKMVRRATGKLDEDLVSIGYRGILMAIDKYDDSVTCAFGTFTEYKIRGVLSNEFANRTRKKRIINEMTISLQTPMEGDNSEGGEDILQDVIAIDNGEEHGYAHIFKDETSSLGLAVKRLTEAQQVLFKMKYIDELCSAVKHFLEVHRGYRKADLQNYLNLYVYIHNERIRYKKCQSKVASKLLKVVFSTKNNYFYNKKSRK